MTSSLQDGAAEQSLREHLLAQVQGTPSGTQGFDAMQASASASPHDHNIDPAIAGPGMHMTATPPSGGDESPLGDGKRGGKRELSTSKRAAQNRAAQRAFRQRKETYIKSLEEQVRDKKVLEENFKAIQAENYQLRDYIINLQSRLLDTQGEYPQPPSNIDLHQPRLDAGQLIATPTAPMGSSAISQLQASAAQATDAILNGTAPSGFKPADPGSVPGIGDGSNIASNGPGIGV